MISYSYLVTNNGNEPLTNIRVVDGGRQDYCGDDAATADVNEGIDDTLVGTITDFTQTRHYLDEMVQRATHDSLTGVANRPLLVDHLRHGIAYGQRYERMVATFVVNVDHFKYVNQSLGHDAGDELLKGVAQRLRGALRDPAADQVFHERRGVEVPAIISATLRKDSFGVPQIFDTMSGV
mgnify:CR=1 FL=1